MLKKILVVEDDADILEILSFILEEEGYEVVRSEDGVACEHLPEILPDLILMDIRLNGARRNGDAICLWLKAESSTCCFPVILLSAEYDLASISYSSGADGYISKPFDVAKLTQAVREMLRAS